MLLWFCLAKLMNMHTALWLNVSCLSSLLPLIGCVFKKNMFFIFSPNYPHLVLQVSSLKLRKPAWTHKHTVVEFGLLFKRSHFIRISIPSQTNKWTAFPDIKLIVRLAIVCHAGRALLSQWKCNLCSVNEEELPCHDSNTKHVVLTAPNFFVEFQAAR